MASAPRLALRPPTALLLLGLWACGSPSEPGGGAPEGPATTVAVVGSTLEIRNTDVLSRNYLVFEGELAARIDLNLDPAASESWLRLEPGATLELPLAAVPGWSDGARSVVLYSWTRSIAHPVANGTQWLGENWLTIRVEL